MMAVLHKPGTHLSVAISTRERPKALESCLDALINAHALPGEIVIVDQSRDDRTRSLVEMYASGPVPVVYHRHTASGLGASQNIAIAQSRQPVVAVTDDDCVPAPDWAARIEAAFSGPEPVDVLTGRVLPLGAPAPGRYPVASRTRATAVGFTRRGMPWDIGSGNNFAARRDWLCRVGGNDERLGPGSPGQGGVDLDLFYRLLRAGAKIRYEPEVLVYHAQTDRAGRLSRRFPYGHGMGACCILWLRQGDGNGLRILSRWLLMRMGRLVEALRTRQGERVYEELLVLYGTIGGVKYGLFARKPHLIEQD